MGYTEGLVDDLRHGGDPSADAVIEELARTDQVRTVSDVLRSLTYNDQPVPQSCPRRSAAGSTSIACCRTGSTATGSSGAATVVVEHGPQVCVALATASLVYCYVCSSTTRLA